MIYIILINMKKEKNKDFLLLFRCLLAIVNSLKTL